MVYDILYDYWRYGCIENGHVAMCDNSLDGLLKQGLFTGIDSYYCCCQDENCNGQNFAEQCGVKLRKMQARTDFKVLMRLMLKADVEMSHYDKLKIEVSI